MPTPWHQDAYYCVDSAKTVSLWIPLDDVPRETTPGSSPGPKMDKSTGRSVLTVRP